jgi:inorganic pyrophosphatase
MSTAFVALPTRDAGTKLWRVVIETPKGSHHKYDLNPALNCFELSKVLPEGFSFPFDFGFLPATLAEDGDPVDVIVLGPAPTFSGCIIPARLLGVIEAKQAERGEEPVRNDRLVAVAAASREYRAVDSAKQLGKELIQELEQFFIAYNRQYDRRFEVLGVRGPRTAAALARRGMKRYARRRSART